MKNFTITGGDFAGANVQIGDGNTQNIVNAFEELISKVDSSDATPSEKEEAKGLLKTLFSNPTFSSILGGATAGLLGLLG